MEEKVYVLTEEQKIQLEESFREAVLALIQTGNILKDAGIIRE